VTRQERARIDSLLASVRRHPGRADVETLARTFQLDPMVVRRVLEAEGLITLERTALEPGVEAQATGVFDIDELRRGS
jgi:hypothetical protein